MDVYFQMQASNGAERIMRGYGEERIRIMNGADNERMTQVYLR